MAGRPKHYKDEELIDSAIGVFWSKGYTAASAQDLMSAMDIGQGSFYRSFPGGKRELYQKSLKQQMENTIHRFNRELGQSEHPIKYLKVFFKSIATRPIAKIENGCYFGNSIIEMGNLDEETKEISVNLLSKMEASIEKAISKAQQEGELKTKITAKMIALYLVNLWNGINITQRTNSNKEQIQELIDMNLKILR
ncbi:TetR/AcrR family transcriptional regulator [Algibacter sp. Ld11]|uniref:TetR/AcrR family transcriptional regulator n=1 Tax=Algibacter sp. Ld11 TaxID=649150 RepID=UPI0038656CDF